MKVPLIYFFCVMIVLLSCCSNKKEQNLSQNEGHLIKYTQNICNEAYKLEVKTYYYYLDLKEFNLENTTIIYPIHKQIVNLYRSDSLISEIKFPIESESIKVDTLIMLRYYIVDVGFDEINNQEVIVFYGGSNSDYITEYLGATNLRGEWVSYHLGTMYENIYEYNKDFFFKGGVDSYSLYKLNRVLPLSFHCN